MEDAAAGTALPGGSAVSAPCSFPADGNMDAAFPFRQHRLFPYPNPKTISGPRGGPPIVRSRQAPVYLQKSHAQGCGIRTNRNLIDSPPLYIVYI